MGRVSPYPVGNTLCCWRFLNKPDRTFTREQLLRMTRLHQNATDRSIDVLVLRLRRKLEGHPRARSIIETKRGFGYAFKTVIELL